MAEMTPELNQAVLDQLLKKLQEQRDVAAASARGEALRRGLGGSSYEGNRVGAVERGYQQSSADTQLGFAVENATRLREERLTKEGQEFTLKAQDLQNQFSSLERQKQEAYASGENEKARQFEAQQKDIDRAWQETQASREQRANLLNTGLGSVANLGGSLLALKMGGGLLGGGGGGLFGGGAAGGGLFGGGTATAGVGGVTGAAPAAGGIGAAGALGLGALGVGGILAQRNLADKRWGMTSKEATLSSLFPIGGPTTFGAIKGVGRILDKNNITGGSVGKIGKKLFCFDPATPITLPDGTTTLIQNIQLEDEIKDGGKVLSVRVSSADETIYAYRGVRVTGNHAVLEDGSWIRIKDSKLATKIGPAGKVISLVTENHRIVINGVTFADEFETDKYESLDLEESLAELNREAA